MEPEEGQLLRSASYLPVADLEATAHHYDAVLGFATAYRGGSPPHFAILVRDDLAIMLKRVDDPSLICPNESQGGTWDAFFWVRDASKLHAEMRANGAEVVYGPVVQEEYGMLEFAVRDLDGHVLGFGESLSSEPGGE